MTIILCLNKIGNFLPRGYILLVPIIPTGKMGTPAFIAIFIAPNFNSCSSPFDERVPSGNMPSTFFSCKILNDFFKERMSTFPRSTGNAFKFLSRTLPKILLKASFLVIKHIFLSIVIAKTIGSK
ncbi:hypothetical protein ES705_18805 [subsurface metagenome]